MNILKTPATVLLAVCLCLPAMPQAAAVNSVTGSTASPSITNPPASGGTSTAMTCNMCKADTTHGLLIQQNGAYHYYALKLDGIQKALVFLPVLLFGFVLLYLLFKLKRGNYNIADMLSENTSVEIDVPNPDPATAPTIPFIKKRILNGSTSRLIALISGLCTVAIATCASSYYFYMYFKTSRAPDLNNLFDVLLALGMGVVPYTINKVTAAIAPSKP